MSGVITYLRMGRKLRASGSVIARQSDSGLVKVKPHREDWKTVWISEDEIKAGHGKPVTATAPKKKAARKPPIKRTAKPAPDPKWRILVNHVRTLEIDHAPEGWPCVRMKTLSELADELESAHSKLSEFLPLTN